MNRIAIVAGFITLAVVIIGPRFYRLGQPAEPVFDEVYFPVFAQDYLGKVDFFDAHPPLGKLIIAGGIRVAGNTPIGWRFLNAVAGVGLIASMAGFMFDATKRWLPATLAVWLMAIDPIALVESRVGLINIYLALFSVLGLWFFWRWWQNPRRLGSFAAALVFFAAAGSVKWIGFGALLAAILFAAVTYFSRRHRPSVQWRPIILAVSILPIVYFGSFLPDLLIRYHGLNKAGFDYLVWWHQNAFSYHAHLTATHPYGSAWWSWPLSLRPLWLYYKSIDYKIVGIFEPGNVVTWVGGLVALAVATTFIVKKSGRSWQPLPLVLYLIITYTTLYLPWAFIGRVKFIYHYFGPVILLHCLTALVLTEICRTKNGRLVTGLFLTLGTTFFIFFLPLLIGYPVSESFYRTHIWFRSWV